MQILYITPSFHHPTLRGPSRHYYFIRELSQRHQITLLSFTRSPIRAEVRREMNLYTEHLFVVDETAVHHQGPQMLSRVPRVGDHLNRLWRRDHALSEMRRIFAQLTREQRFDLVLFHGKPVFRVIDGWNDLPIVADFCDATSMRYASRMRQLPLLELPLLAARYVAMRRVERKLIQKTDHLAFISARDRRAVLGCHSTATVIPLGVDLDYWTRSSAPARPRCLIFTGVMNYRPNAEAAVRLVDRILPRVRNVMPDVELIIAGRDPSLDLIKRTRQIPGVTVTGFVDDLRRFMERATVYVAPIQVASGTQTKIIEALAMEVPVVTTSEVCDGLRINDLIDPPVIQAGSDADFAQHILHLLSHRDERQRLVTAGRQYAETHFSWQRSALMLEDLCHAAVGRTIRGHERISVDGLGPNRREPARPHADL